HSVTPAVALGAPLYPNQALWQGTGQAENFPPPKIHPAPDVLQFRLLPTRGRRGARRLFLYKDGVQIRELDADGAGGEFTIPSARREDSGSYSCRSRSRSEPPDWSDPSDDVRIVVAGERSGLASLLPPSPTPSQTHRGSLGQWDPQSQSVRFLLYKDGNRTVLQEAEPTRNVAEFPIRDVSRRHGGKYLCYYRSKSDPPVWSHPSDPVELVVAGEGPGSASPLPAPPPAGPSEGLSTDGTLRARLSPEPHRWGRGGFPATGEQQLLEVQG
uniref:Ig-like domain-containing protein n=1 Tax=Chelydra serpentina TaxID=8475 RepID=A0A8C3SWZ3_CHESE